MDHLTAHLYGIDQALAPNTLRQKTFGFGNNANQGDTSWGEVAGGFYYTTSIYPSTNATWRVTIHGQSGRTAYIDLYDVTAATSVATLSSSNGTLVVAAPKGASFWVVCSFCRPLAIVTCFGLLYTRQ